jgi:hypothetical protein
MPIYRPTTLDAIHLDGVLSLDLDRGRAVVELAQVSFVDAYALAGLACFIASAARDGLPVELVLPENIDVRSWLSRMHLGEVLDAFEVRVEGVLPRVAERDRRDTLIELERFDDSFGSHRLASFIWERLAGGVDGEVVTSCSRRPVSWARMWSSTPVRPSGGSSPPSATRPEHPRSGSSWRWGMWASASGSRSAPDTATCRTRRPSGERSSGTSPASRTKAAAKGFRVSSRGSRRSVASSGSGAVPPRGW